MKNKVLSKDLTVYDVAVEVFDFLKFKEGEFRTTFLGELVELDFNGKEIFIHLNSGQSFKVDIVEMR